MQSIIRKHRVLFGWLIVLLIGVPMLFFGVPSFLDGNPNDVEDPPIVEVGGIPVKSSQFQRNLDSMAKSRATADKQPTFAELDQEGVVGEVLDQMVNSALLDVEVEARTFDVARESLVKQLQKEAIFKNEAGNFDAEAWNTWVESNEEAGINWKELYNDLGKELSRQAYLDLIRKPGARVLESELDYQLTDDYTKIKVRYLQVQPPVANDSPELREFYDANVETFRRPDAKNASYVSYSLRAPKPAKADELVAQARSGADFSTLANENSELKTENGGDMGWRRERDRELEHRKPMFALKPGEVSEPIEGPNGFYIYKVEEERLVDDVGNVIPAEATEEAKAAGIREQHVRQIFLQSLLSEEDKTAKTAEAKVLADKAAEMGNLPAAAAELGFELKQVGPFTDKDTEIPGIPTADVSEFRKAFGDEAISDYNVITARENVYVAVLDGKVQGEIPAFEEVIEEVKTAFMRDSDKYKDRVKEYADKITAGAKTLEEAKALVPDMTSQVAELDFFTRKEMLWQQQFYVAPTQIYEEIGRDPIGTMGGPFSDFRNNTYFVELADRQAPTDEDKAKWPEEKKQLREQIAARKGMQMLEDYAEHLRETKLPELNVAFNTDLINQIVGRDVVEPTVDETAKAAEEAATPSEAVSTTPTATPEAIAAPATDGAPAAAEATPVEAAPAEAAPAAEAPVVETPAATEAPAAQ